jgi:hypothetical protein
MQSSFSQKAVASQLQYSEISYFIIYHGITEINKSLDQKFIYLKILRSFSFRTEKLIVWQTD